MPSFSSKAKVWRLGKKCCKPISNEPSKSCGVYLGAKKRAQAELGLKNFGRNPGTRLYENMRDGTDSYRVVLVQKPALANGSA